MQKIGQGGIVTHVTQVLYFLNSADTNKEIASQTSKGITYLRLAGGLLGFSFSSGPDENR